MTTRDAELVEELLTLTHGLPGSDIAEAIGVSDATISKWRNGKRPKYLHAPTRQRIEEVLTNPSWEFLATSPLLTHESPPAHRALLDQRVLAAAKWLGALEVRTRNLMRDIATVREQLLQKPKNPVIRQGKRGARIDVPPPGKKRA